MKYIVIIALIFSSCSTERLFNRAISKDRQKVCELAYKTCDNARDSIVVEKVVDNYIYDTVIAFSFGSGGDVDTVNITDTLFLEDDGAKAKVWAYKNKLTGVLTTADSLKKEVQLYKQIITEKTNSFQKSMVECRGKDAKIKNLQKDKAWKKVWRTIAIISGIILILILWLKGLFRR